MRRGLRFDRFLHVHLATAGCDSRGDSSKPRCAWSTMFAANFALVHNLNSFNPSDRAISSARSSTSRQCPRRADAASTVGFSISICERLRDKAQSAQPLGPSSHITARCPKRINRSLKTRPDRPIGRRLHTSGMLRARLQRLSTLQQPIARGRKVSLTF